MNQLDEFFISFTTKGITELKDALKDINEKLDNLDKSFTKSTKKGDDFFGKFTHWAKGIALVTAAVGTFTKAISDAFKMSNDIIRLNVVADVAGVKAEDVEALAIATAPFLGGKKDIGAASNFYRNMTETQTEWWRGQYSQKVIDEMSRAGVLIKPDATQEQYMSGLIQALSFYQGQHTQQAIGARNLFAQAFGLTDEQMLLFAKGQDYVNNALDYGYQHLTLSGDKNLKNSVDNAKAKMELKEQWDKLVADLIPVATALTKVMTIVVDWLRPIARFLGRIAEWVSKKLEKPMDYMADYGDDKLNSTDLTVAATAELEDIAGDKTQPRWKRKLSEALAGIGNWLTKEVAERNGKTVDELLKESGEHLEAAGKPAVYLDQYGNKNTRQVTQKVEVGTINITGMKEDAAIQTAGLIQDKLNELNFQPATLGNGEQ